MHQAEQIGLDGFLIKPVSPSVLFDTIMHAFGEGIPETSRISKRNEEIENLKDIQGAQILLVEDNEINQQVAMEILQGAGLNVTVANNGQEGVDVAKKNSYDAILMDIQMPVMDGYEATRRIRNSECGLQPIGDIGASAPEGMRNEGKDPIPIIAMTAHAMAGDEQKSIEAGMNDHVTKPIEPDQLFASLQKWIKPLDNRINDISPKSSAAKAASHSADLSGDELPLSLAGFDLAQGLQRLRGNQKLYKKLLVDFAANYSQAATDIRKRLDDKNLVQAHQLVHNLKGLAGNLAATDLFASAVELERLIKNGNQKSFPPQKMLQQKFYALEHALNQALESAQSLEADNEDMPMKIALEEMAELPAELANDVAKRIHTYAEMGDVMQLVQLADELKSRAEVYGPISDGIARMARDFDFESILILANELKE